MSISVGLVIYYCQVNDQQREMKDTLEQKKKAVEEAAKKEKDALQEEHDNTVYTLEKLAELLEKMLSNETSWADTPDSKFVWKTEFECPICFEVFL